MNDKDYDIIKKEIVINASVDKVFSAYNLILSN